MLEQPGASWAFLSLGSCRVFRHGLYIWVPFSSCPTGLHQGSQTTCRAGQGSRTSIPRNKTEVVLPFPIKPQKSCNINFAALLASRVTGAPRWENRAHRLHLFLRGASGPYFELHVRWNIFLQLPLFKQGTIFHCRLSHKHSPS